MNAELKEKQNKIIKEIEELSNQLDNYGFEDIDEAEEVINDKKYLKADKNKAKKYIELNDKIESLNDELIAIKRLIKPKNKPVPKRSEAEKEAQKRYRQKLKLQKEQNELNEMLGSISGKILRRKKDLEFEQYQTSKSTNYELIDKLQDEINELIPQKSILIKQINNVKNNNKVERKPRERIYTDDEKKVIRSEQNRKYYLNRKK